MVVANPEAPVRRVSGPLIGFIACLLGLVALLFAPLWAPTLLRLEHWTADWRTAFLSHRAPEAHERLAVILISSETLESYPYLSPVDRGLLADLVRAVDGAGAHTIGLDVFFAKATEKIKDEALLNAIRQAKAEIVMAGVDHRGRLKAKQKHFQQDFLRRAGRPVGFINLRKEQDGVIRYRPESAVDSDIPNSFSYQLARAEITATGEKPARISWLLPPRNSKQTFLTLAAEALLTSTTAAAASSRKSDIRKLKGRIVLIGGEFAYRDRHETPLTVRSGKKNAWRHGSRPANRATAR